MKLDDETSEMNSYKCTLGATRESETLNTFTDNKSILFSFKDSPVLRIRKFFIGTFELFLVTTVIKCFQFRTVLLTSVDGCKPFRTSSMKVKLRSKS